MTRRQPGDLGRQRQGARKIVRGGKGRGLQVPALQETRSRTRAVAAGWIGEGFRPEEGNACERQ